jgi:putative FmdB family regulatory protein
MPAYDYRCSKCEKPFTFVRSIKDDDPGYSCDTCNLALERVYYSVGVTFNGSGFYKTDNRKR